MSRRTRLDIVPPDYTQRHAGRVVTNVFDHVSDRTRYLRETMADFTSLRDIRRFAEKALKHLVMDMSEGQEKNLLWQCRFLAGADRRLFTYHFEVRRDGRGGAHITLTALPGRVTHHAATRLLQHHKSKTLKDLLEHLRYASAFANEASKSKAEGAVTDIRGDQYRFKYDREEGSILATFIAESSVDLAVPRPRHAASAGARTKRVKQAEGEAIPTAPAAVRNPESAQEAPREISASEPECALADTAMHENPASMPGTGKPVAEVSTDTATSALTPFHAERNHAVTCIRKKRKIPVTFRRRRVLRPELSGTAVEPPCVVCRESGSREVFC